MNKKNITLCASMSFSKQTDHWKQKLQKSGHNVIQYPKPISGDFLSGYKKEFTEHYQNITKSDVIFVLNLEKNDINGYIGAAVFAEIAFAVGINLTSRRENQIEIFYLNPIPKSLPHSEELQLWIKLGWIKQWK